MVVVGGKGGEKGAEGHVPGDEMLIGRPIMEEPGTVAVPLPLPMCKVRSGRVALQGTSLGESVSGGPFLVWGVRGGGLGDDRGREQWKRGFLLLALEHFCKNSKGVPWPQVVLN